MRLMTLTRFCSFIAIERVSMDGGPVTGDSSSVVNKGYTYNITIDGWMLQWRRAGVPVVCGWMTGIVLIKLAIHICFSESFLIISLL